MNKTISALIAVFGSLATEAALFYFARRTGLWLQPFLGIVLIPVLLLLYVGLGWLVRRFRLTEAKTISARVAFWLIPVTWQLVAGYVSGTPKAMFERFVMQQMPASIQNFEWQGGVGIDGYFDFAFKLDAADTEKLIQQLNLEPDTNSMSLPQSDLQKYISGRTAWVKQPQEKLISPLFYQRTTPWKIELITDANHRQVYIFR